MSLAPIEAYVGLGSNLDNPRRQVENALHALARLPQTRLLAHSRLYRTPPWGGIAQPDFINAVARLETTLAAEDLMRALLDLERTSGRERGTERYGPRVLDLDLLLYGHQRLDAAGLTVPHPRLAERAFALVPLHEIAPDLEIPGRGGIADLLARIDVDGIAPLL